MKKNSQVDELLQIPGIGKSLARDLHSLDIHRITDLKNKSPQKLYDKLCIVTQNRQDPCVLYTFRCAVYYASTHKHDPQLLKWWNWKNRELE